MNSFLIDNDTLKKRGFTNRNVEASILTTTLTRVQDTMLIPIIGTALFKRLSTGVKDDDLNADELVLMNEYVAPFLISAVDFRIVNHLIYEIRSKTVGKSSDQYIESATQSESIMLKDDLRKDVEVYREQLIAYLRTNSSKFPQYDDCSCDTGGVNPDKGSKFVPIVW